MITDAVTLTPAESRLIVRLLGKLQGHIESAIESSLAEGETEPKEEWLRADIRRDRKDWKAAEDLIKRLTRLPLCICERKNNNYTADNPYCSYPHGKVASARRARKATA